MKMRIPTNKEWDKLVDMTSGYDEKMHWNHMYSHVNDTENEYHIPVPSRAYRGYFSARNWSSGSASNRHAYLGFRPAIVGLPLDTPLSEGAVCIIGTLYMNGGPVKVPQNPVQNGDIADYIPGAKLEMREAMEDPAYQVTGIHLGDGVLVADRNLLKGISRNDIDGAISMEPIKESGMGDEIPDTLKDKPIYDWTLREIYEYCHRQHLDCLYHGACCFAVRESCILTSLLGQGVGCPQEWDLYKIPGFSERDGRMTLRQKFERHEASYTCQMGQEEYGEAIQDYHRYIGGLSNFTEDDYTAAEAVGWSRSDIKDLCQPRS